MEWLLAVYWWIIFPAIELREGILATFVWIDGLVILLGLVLYTRIRRQGHLKRKETGKMFKGKNGKAVSDWIGHAQKVLKEAEQKQEELELLPKIGEVPQYIDMLSEATKGLRKSLQLPVGAEMQEQVVKWLAMVSEAMIKAEEIRIRTILARDAAAHSAALAGPEMEFALLSGVETLKALKKYQPELGYDLQDFKLPLQNYVKQAVALNLHKQFASQAGIDLPKGFMGPLEGMEQLLPTPWDPDLALVDDGNDLGAARSVGAANQADDDDDDVVEGTFVESDDHPMDGLLSSDEIGEQRIFEPDEDVESGPNGREHPEILWDKEGEK